MFVCFVAAAALAQEHKWVFIYFLIRTAPLNEFEHFTCCSGLETNK